MLSRCTTNAFGVFEKYIQHNVPTFLAPVTHANNTLQPVRYIAKHWNPKFKKERKLKVVTLEQMRKSRGLRPDQKDYYKSEYGFPLHHNVTEKPFFMTCTDTILNPYIPPEGDGKYSITTKEGFNQKIERIKHKVSSMNAIRKIGNQDMEFDKKDFIKEAVEIYEKAHEALATKDENELIQYVTEHACLKMSYGAKLKTIRWKLIKYLEPVRIVQAKHELDSIENKSFGQITLRFHTQQMLSIYDRFGRLIQGSDILAKDVLEYIVFEKPLWFKYGRWRLHDKIIPSWVPQEEIADKTYTMQEPSQ